MNNNYEDMSVIDVLKCVKNRNMLLPDIQREYVWDYTEIEKLFESIVDEYPIGSCIMWKTNKTNLNKEKPNLYFFLRNFKQSESKNEKAPEVFSDETDYYIVLDGQQRITSLNIALYGSFTSYKGGRGHARKKKESWIKRELYYNLDFYNSIEDDDENPKKKFAFLSEDEAKIGNWYKVNQIVTFDDLHTYSQTLTKSNYMQKSQTDLFNLFKRLNDHFSGLIHYYCITEKNYDRALDIFVRVNSTGKKLSKSDLLFSTLIDGWKDNDKDKIDAFLDIINKKGDGFLFNRDFLMRLALVLVDEDTNLKIQSFTNKEIIDKIRSNWNKIKLATEEMVNVLVNIGLSNDSLTSYNATMPITYYLFRGGEIKNEESKRETKKFLSLAMANRLFGVASNSALTKTRNVFKELDCKKTSFSLSLFKTIKLTGNRTFVAKKENIEHWLDTYEKGVNTYTILALLYPHLKLSIEKFHQDHCHPYTDFDTKKIKKLNLSETKLEDWQKKRNLLPNLQFLEGGENQSKNKTPLKKWIESGNTIKYLPKNISLDSLELKNFDEFFEKRRILIKKELFKLFDLEYDSLDEEKDNNRFKTQL